ncbi:ATP-dependent RNA helicase [Spiroplasma sabaudiense Ar-1343]|uniref:ATP-dependent RNA helicase n=1 Tax=Spiroplasma sabaudiense Ar-1343 TaxID=1276257 RepID=W6AA77_9MOLU|nr:DEAD/DEAH box helicase [Spiroplasma sabaudiense]AHI53740.1 ATP-dependent RNA helicase [Spiroplasma sabaudiense Ar-1343]
MSFEKFGFKKFINDALKSINFLEPTSIQDKVIPKIKKYNNIVAQAHTGTGKTHAFLLPILNNIDILEKKVQAVIITPTRELARQIYANVNEILNFNSEITKACFIGGQDITKQQESLSKVQPMVVVGTPSRLKELYENGSLKITTTKFLVIDEFDMIFDLGFIEEIDLLLSRINENVNISLFSATLPNELKPFLVKYLNNALFIDDSKNKPSNKNIEHALIWTKNRENQTVFNNLISSINPFIVMIFVNRKDQVKNVVSWLKELDITNVGELHAGLDPRMRSSMQKRIQNNEFKYIVATDIAARGLDINGVSHVISIDLPNDLSYYIHRSGRTGRNNFNGQSFVLHNSDNQNSIDDLRKIGVEFVNYKFIENKLVETTIKTKKPKFYNPNSPGEIASKKVVAKYKKDKVKPGYKKKRKAELAEIKRKIRRDHIKENISKIKKAKYQKRREEIFED